jgi:hypothetical protein
MRNSSKGTNNSFAHPLPLPLRHLLVPLLPHRLPRLALAACSSSWYRNAQRSKSRAAAGRRAPSAWGCTCPWRCSWGLIVCCGYQLARMLFPARVGYFSVADPAKMPVGRTRFRAEHPLSRTLWDNYPKKTLFFLRTGLFYNPQKIVTRPGYCSFVFPGKAFSPLPANTVHATGQLTR